MARGLLDDLGSAFRARADPVPAKGMSEYMRDQPSFVGLPAPVQRTLAKEVLSKHPVPDGTKLRRIVTACWARPERELQYVLCDLLARRAETLVPGFLPTVERLMTTNSWWDAVRRSVHAHADELSGLSQREALREITPSRRTV
jgi:3-methyladenine DNA glycosylase AlkD